ncbi:erythroblast NAD(P)(+)--arginine ADP-ribosyltransferase-like [Mugil cephalus]|uniref:erythroblast NAD(P)(+)--arginine ADP-ribosyltransferase-like n=1 Tax=Mugil cephalus TaxID=48193 RepID=UPI001FB7BBF7|nr:erythroblast NAD(P)(+)--arginine ADP-ribosyltransferase-like [Mugil cephalus]
MDNKLWIACFWKMAMAALLAAALMGKNDAKAEIQLDMAPNSVDDMYAGCESKMEALVNSTYLVNELKNDKVFEKAWKNATINKNPELSEYQRRAVYVYTDKDTNIYSVFNEKVRTQRSSYKTEAFKYHSLHFFLTRALQTLKLKNKKCLTGYRRTNLSFTYNGTFRFGSFTSSSHTTYANDTFGTKTCFEINTCFGAEISSYSAFESEREILIPPYEVFKVTKTERTTKKKPLPCEVVYTVKSERTQSNLNCALVKKK